MGKNTPGIWIVAAVLFAAAFGAGTVVMMASGGQRPDSLLGKWEPIGPVPSTIEFTSNSVIITVQERQVSTYRVRYKAVTVESGGRPTRTS